MCTCVDEFLSLFSKGNGKRQRKFVVGIACELNEKSWDTGYKLLNFRNVHLEIVQCELSLGHLHLQNDDTVHISWSIYRL